MISLEKLMILRPLQKLPQNVGDLGKFIVAKCFELLPKVHESFECIRERERERKKRDGKKRFLSLLIVFPM